MYEIKHEFKSFDELEDFLRNWQSWGGECHDVVGTLTFIIACLDNLIKNVPLEVLEDYEEQFTPKQQKMLQFLADLPVGEE